MQDGTTLLVRQHGRAWGNKGKEKRKKRKKDKRSRGGEGDVWWDVGVGFAKYRFGDWMGVCYMCSMQIRVRKRKKMLDIGERDIGCGCRGRGESSQ